MKVSAQDLDRLIFEIAPVDCDALRAKYMAGDFPRGAGAVQDLDKRYRWDLYWHVFDRGFRFNGEYNDSHIDTALRRAVPPITERLGR